MTRAAQQSNRARPLTLIPDAAATLFAVRANPGIPARGVIAVCDFGGSGTSITLVDGAAEYQPLAPTFRHPDFSGDLIDRALLTAVLANMPSADTSDPSGTSAIDSLGRLRAGCRSAKEQLSSSTVTTLPDGDIRLTRNELDDAFRESLNGFLAVLEETIRGNGIRGNDLAAVVSVGGGAQIPAVTTMLSGRFRVPVITTPRPQLAAAIGAALRATRGPGDAVATALTPAPWPPANRSSKTGGKGPSNRRQPNPSSGPTLGCRSRCCDRCRRWPGRNPMTIRGCCRYARAPTRAMKRSGAATGSGYTSARPALNFQQPARSRRESKPTVILWYRLPAVLAIGTAVAVLLVGMAVAMGFGSDDAPATTPAPGGSTAPRFLGAGFAGKSTVCARKPGAGRGSARTSRSRRCATPANYAPAAPAPPPIPAAPQLVPQIPAIPAHPAPSRAKPSSFPASRSSVRYCAMSQIASNMMGHTGRGNAPCPTPCSITTFAPGIALAVATPPAGRINASRVPCMTNVGSRNCERRSVLFGAASIAACWRSLPSGSYARRKLSGQPR